MWLGATLDSGLAAFPNLAPPLGLAPLKSIAVKLTKAVLTVYLSGLWR